MRLSDEQRIAWLRLIRSEKVGPSSFHQLLQRYGSAQAALDALPELAAKGGALRGLRIATVGEAEREIDAAERHGSRFVALEDNDYPALLRQVDNPPPLLAVKGGGKTLQLHGVAIVGARNASLGGIKLARLFAADLGKAGFAVVSGLARGVDTAAHQGSIESGTVAVLAGGLDKPYPPEILRLAVDIVANGGALISEMPFGWSPKAIDFPRRNRLISGLSHGLLVIEAAQRSGSLISARMAGEQGRLVFAVPGSPLDERCAGSNALLKDGAILVTEADDVIRSLRPMIGDLFATGLSRAGASIPSAEDMIATGTEDDGRDRVLECLSPVPADVDEIVRHTGIPAAEVHLILLELDLAGRLERHSGGAVSLAHVGA